MKYPEIEVQLSGNNGNAFSIIGRMINALRNGSVSKVEIEQFTEEAQSGDYDHLLQTCMKWVDVT